MSSYVLLEVGNITLVKNSSQPKKNAENLSDVHQDSYQSFIDEQMHWQ
jgi:hypothetical protein